MSSDPVRLIDILTTATSIASYLGAPEIVPGHLRDALRVLRGAVAVEDLGAGMPPIIPRPPGGPTVRPDVQSLIQRWQREAIRDITQPLDLHQLEMLEEELRALPGSDTASP